MLKHYKIRSPQGDEYVKLDKDDSIVEVLLYCVRNQYNLHHVIVLETATTHIRKPILELATMDDLDQALNAFRR